MSDERPDVVIRLGSHAEKEYVLKLAMFLDGLIVGANLFETTPGATASLLVTVAGKDTSLFIDPMTYAYGAYVDPSTGRLRTDLDWIKSDQIRKDGKQRKRTVRDFKRSYRALAECIGSPLVEAVHESRAVSPARFTDDEQQRKFCESVAGYQIERIARVFQEDPELKDFKEDIPPLAAVFAPYFYVEPNHADEWLTLNLGLMRKTSGLRLGRPIHAVLCADVTQLKDESVRARILEELPKTGIAGVWLWFSGFFEESESTEVLEEYRDLVLGLAKHVEVRAMRGGFFSLCLSKFGMQGISHGVGYGEQKDVVPVIGQSIPTVRYYLPALARRLGVPDIERAFDALDVTTPRDFHKKVCNCAVCRGVVSTSVKEFSAFGEMRLSRPDAKRRAQTPAAAKRCRFHFLLCRLRERDEFRRLSVKEVVRRLGKAEKTWGVQPSLRKAGEQLGRWSEVLGHEA